MRGKGQVTGDLPAQPETRDRGKYPVDITIRGQVWTSLPKFDREEPRGSDPKHQPESATAAGTRAQMDVWHV